VFREPEIYVARKRKKQNASGIESNRQTTIYRGKRGDISVYRGIQTIITDCTPVTTFGIALSDDLSFLEVILQSLFILLKEGLSGKLDLTHYHCLRDSSKLPRAF
jgi:hypothetical protein